MARPTIFRRRLRDPAECRVEVGSVVARCVRPCGVDDAALLFLRRYLRSAELGGLQPCRCQRLNAALQLLGDGLSGARQPSISCLPSSRDRYRTCPTLVRRGGIFHVPTHAGALRSMWRAKPPKTAATPTSTRKSPSDIGRFMTADCSQMHLSIYIGRNMGHPYAPPAVHGFSRIKLRGCKPARPRPHRRSPCRAFHDDRIIRRLAPVKLMSALQ